MHVEAKYTCKYDCRYRSINQHDAGWGTNILMIEIGKRFLPELKEM